MKYYNKVFDIFLYEGVFIFLFSLLLLLLNDIYTEIFFKVSISSIITAGVLWITGHLFNLFAKEDDFEESWFLVNRPKAGYFFKIYFQYFLKVRNISLSFEIWNYQKQSSNLSAAGAHLEHIGALTGQWHRYMLFYWSVPIHWHKMISWKILISAAAIQIWISGNWSIGGW